MNIYVAHSNKFDYVKKLYEPIRKSETLKKYNFFFPHDQANKLVKTKEIIKNYDLVIAEVSLPSIGLGIELGWADYSNIPILCVYEKGIKVGSSLKFITNNFMEYENTEDFITKLEHFLDRS